jgi:hypothetical protein
LRWLSLNRTPITDRGLASLATLENLETLIVSRQGWTADGFRVTDRSIPHLAKLRSLKQLSLRGADLTEAGVERLRAELADCKIEL